MKKKSLGVILLLSFLCCFAWIQPVQAQTANRIIKVNVVRNMQTRHFYFVPTYVPCLSGPTNIELINTTESSPVIQLENYVRFVIQPYSFAIKTEFIGHNSHWVLLEPNYLGGNAYLYFRRCGFEYALPKNINPVSQPNPQPYNPIPPIYNPYHRIGAICLDRTRSFAIGRGACAFHGGVKYWLF